MWSLQHSTLKIVRTQDLRKNLQILWGFLKDLGDVDPLGDLKRLPASKDYPCCGTPPEINMEPENQDTHIPHHHFWVPAVSFLGGVTWITWSRDLHRCWKRQDIQPPSAIVWYHLWLQSRSSHCVWATKMIQGSLLSNRDAAGFKHVVFCSRKMYPFEAESEFVLYHPIGSNIPLLLLIYQVRIRILYITI